MFSLYLVLLFVGTVAGSHYRGGTMSYTIRANSNNMTARGQEVLVQVTQRHSWNRLRWFCNNTDPNSGDIIGEDLLSNNPNSTYNSSGIPPIDARVRCTDYSEQFDYSSGESSVTVSLPINKRIEYFYTSCCWIPLLPPDSASDWSLKFIINTNRRADGTWNSSPKTAMNPIVQVQLGKVHAIRIPMADGDGDTTRCRWGKTPEECGSVCAVKGPLRSNPCELTYNATALGYQAVALVIEDFDSNNNTLSAIPLQFLIHVVNISQSNCSEPRAYIGEWSGDSCIGIESNTTFSTRVQIEIPCNDTSVTLKDVLTTSPGGLIKGSIIPDRLNRNKYTMSVEWTPQSYQSGIQQLCFTPVDSEERMGSPVCLTFQVDVSPPEFISMTPIGLVPANQSTWIIKTDRDIVEPKRSSGVYVRFFKRSTNEEVYRVDVATVGNVLYQVRQITFFTRGYTWEQSEEYYILLDNGIAIINESCGVESALMNNSNAWVFRVANAPTTSTEMMTTTMKFTSTTTTEFISTTITATASPKPTCPRWLPFNTISNESTNANEPNFTFCFSVETELADVTIAANTWVPCMIWKLSGMADPLLELYTEPGETLLAQNDDGNSLAVQNCYAAVLSYRLPKGDYRVVIRSPKCAYGKFELRFTAEIDSINV